MQTISELSFSFGIEFILFKDPLFMSGQKISMKSKNIEIKKFLRNFKQILNFLLPSPTHKINESTSIMSLIFFSSELHERIPLSVMTYIFADELILKD